MGLYFNMELPPLNNDTRPLKQNEYQYFSKLVYYYCGINLHEGKKELIKTRLYDRLVTLKLSSFEEYGKYLEDPANKNEITHLIDALSTNYTYFFREQAHFDFLKEYLVQLIKKQKKGKKRIRLWSAGCSSGEEAYNIAFVVCEVLEKYPSADIKILATDISSRILKRAKEGAYKKEKLEAMPQMLKLKYFEQQGDKFLVVDKIKNLVQYRKHSVVGKWPFKGTFDVIFCRNVMIYFDQETRQNLLNRFQKYLNNKGVLFLGSSESLIGIKHTLKYVHPTVYQKIEEK